MTTTILDLNDRTDFPLAPTQAPASVWMRARWTDAWTARPDLVPTQAVWAAFPDVSTATLQYRYGQVTLPGAASPTTYVPITARGYWVLIAYPADDSETPLSWLGYAEYPMAIAHTPARSGQVTSGIQAVPCYGMERIWEHATIEGTVGESGDADAWTRFGTVTQPFNLTDKGNRSAAKKELDDTRDSTAYGFARPTDAPATWSTRDIVEHLTTFHAPTASRILPNSDSDPTAEIPWRIAGLTNLPDWDAPNLPADGRTVADVLGSLISPSRLSSMAVLPTVDYSGALPSVTAVTMQFHTRLTEQITVPGITGDLPYTADATNIEAIDDPLTSIRHTVDASDVVDEVIVQGPREISVCTLRYATGQLVDGWDAGDELSFIAGASNDLDWGDWSQSQRQAENRSVRSKLDAVFRDLKLDEDFDGTVDVDHAVFPDSETGTEPADPADFHVPFAGSIDFLPDLPLYVGIDYSGDPTAVDESDGIERRPPLITLENSGTFDRDVVRFVGEPAVLPTVDFRPFSLEVVPVTTPRPGLRMNVRGAPRFVITDEEGNAADGDRLTAYDYTTMEATLAIRGDRRPRWTKTNGTPVEGVDAVRRRVYTLDGPTYELVYIAVDTVVDLDADISGVAETSDGGVLRDPLPSLKAAAELLAAHQHAPRHRMVLHTARRLQTLSLGTIIGTVDVAGTSLDAPVVEIRIDSPAGATHATQTITAAAYAVDLLAALAAGGSNG